MLNRIFYLFSLALILSWMAASGCRKPLSFSTDHLEFSQDTVLFDTVFTTIGSTTQRFKLYNRENKTVKIEGIQLMGGTDSPFRINVDGVPGTDFGEIELESRDSLFVFVEVTLDPNGGILPLVVEDSIRFRTNGVDQYVNLVVWGQDAYFHYNEVLDLDVSPVWPNDKPHVIYGFAVVKEGETLTIPSGTTVHLHKNSFLFVYKGALNIAGTLTEPVTFCGDRLEPSYDDVSGQYYGIYLQEALPSTINYCNIKNATAGIHIYSENSANTDYTVKLTNSTITNCARYGIFLFTDSLKNNPRLAAENSIISKNAFHSLFVLGGGEYRINHCHLLGYSSEGQSPALGLSNHYTNQDGITWVMDINEASITNSVVYGYLDQEYAFDTLNPGGSTVLNYDFQSNLIRSKDVPTDAFFTSGVANIWNQNPGFRDIGEGDFFYWASSPLTESGNSAFPNQLFNSTAIDIRGITRQPPFDIGAYEIE